MTRLLATLSFLTIASFAVPLFASAQQTQNIFGGSGPVTQTVTGGAGQVALMNPLGTTSLAGFLTSILNVVIQVGTIVIVLMMVFVGYKFVIAQGAPAKLEEAKRMLMWTLIGALVLLGAQAIATGIQNTVSALGG